MEPAGVSLPRVLGHENAGWVEEVGDGVTTVAKGDAVLVYPPYSCGLCVACRRGNDMHCERHDFTGLSVDGGFADFVLVVGALAAQAARRRRAGGGRAARRRGPDRVPRGAARRPPARAGHDRSRDRRRRRRAHRGAARPRARREPRRRRRHGRAPSPSRRRARRGRRGRRRGRGARGDRRSGRGRRLRLRRHRPDARRRDCGSRAWRHALDHRLRRHALAADERARRQRARGHGEPRRHVDRPVGDPAAPRRRADHAEDGDAPARAGERGAREAAGAARSPAAPCSCPAESDRSQRRPALCVGPVYESRRPQHSACRRRVRRALGV